MPPIIKAPLLMDVDDPASLSRLYVSSHAFFAYVDGAFIILDRKSDRYLFIGEGDASAILRELGKDGPTAGSEAIHPAVSALEREGLVTRDANSGKKLTFLEGFPGSLELPGPKVDAIPNVRIGHVLDLAFACAKSAFLLKVRGFDTAVRSVEALRKRQPPSDRQSLDSISNLVEIYHRVKPYFFSAKDRCVMNSLVMIHFLAKYGIYPNWVFGVRLHPFEAHCWVEDESLLYNDQFSRTDGFTPIMKV